MDTSSASGYYRPSARTKVVSAFHRSGIRFGGAVLSVTGFDMHRLADTPELTRHRGCGACGVVSARAARRRCPFAKSHPGIHARGAVEE